MIERFKQRKIGKQLVSVGVVSLAFAIHPMVKAEENQTTGEPSQEVVVSEGDSVLPVDTVTGLHNENLMEEGMDLNEAKATIEEGVGLNEAEVTVKQTEMPISNPEQGGSNPFSEEGAESELVVEAIAVGDETIQGKYEANAILVLDRNDEPEITIDRPVTADEEGKFSLPLKRPLSYNEKIKVSAFSTASLESEEEEGGYAEVTLYTPKHEASQVQEDGVLEQENGKHQVQIEPVSIGDTVVKGRTSARGTVYLMINGTFVSPETSIGEDGRFQIHFLDRLHGLHFQEGDQFSLSFQTSDHSPLYVQEMVQAKSREAEEEYYTIPLSMSTKAFAGKIQPYQQVKLYHADSKELVAVQVSNQEGYYLAPLADLRPGETYYRLEYNALNDISRFTKEMVDGPSETLSVEDNKGIIIELLEFDESDATPGPLTLISKLHHQSQRVSGKVDQPHALIQLRSPEKTFPLIQADQLGYWTLDNGDIGEAFKEGEEITIMALDPVDYRPLYQITSVVRNLDKEDEAILEEDWEEEERLMEGKAVITDAMPSLKEDVEDLKRNQTLEKVTQEGLSDAKSHQSEIKKQTPKPLDGIKPHSRHHHRDYHSLMQASIVLPQESNQNMRVARVYPMPVAQKEMVQNKNSRRTNPFSKENQEEGLPKTNDANGFFQPLLALLLSGGPVYLKKYKK